MSVYRGFIAGICLSIGCLLISCGGSGTTGGSTPPPVTTPTPTPSPSGVLSDYKLTGNTVPVHDPSMIRQGETYYAFTTDVLGLPPGNYLPIRCSEDLTAWRSCGSIFPSAMPAWVVAKVPGIVGLWAPDISYFNGLYHAYYAGSTLGSQQSVIGVATNTTLDPNDPAYQWVDHGEVLESHPGDHFNAIDPNILVNDDGKIWMSFGSYWDGIYQREIDPATGKLLDSNQNMYHLAQRWVQYDPLEGASLFHRGDYYYLFVSIDYCCNQDVATDNYKIAVGRGTSPNGPFYDSTGKDMLQGGLDILLQSNSAWVGPGGQTVYHDPETGKDLIIFHALYLPQGGTMFMWVNQLDWQNDWPVIQKN